MPRNHPLELVPDCVSDDVRDEPQARVPEDPQRWPLHDPDAWALPFGVYPFNSAIDREE
jgi:hypothetical protein